MIVPAATGQHTTVSPVSRRRLADTFLEGLSMNTRRAYARDLASFGSFLSLSGHDAAEHLVALPAGQANATVLQYRDQLVALGLQSATINRRLAALRSVVRLARLIGLITWTIEIRSLKVQPYRDTRGPGRRGVRLLFDEIAAHGDTPPSRRDLAISRMLFDLALRRGEVVSLDVQHLHLDEAYVEVLRKGGAGRVHLTLPAKTIAALQRWLEYRGAESGPLFSNFDRSGKGQRLTANSIWRLLRRYGDRIGLMIRPHGLRHAAVTEALEMTGGDMRAVARFSGHKKLETILVYDDNRRDLGGNVARLVSEGV
jgi:integrase/recombinase XerC